MRRRFAPLVLSAFLVNGCAAGNVTTDYDPEVSFDERGTWGWLPSPPPNPLTLRPALGRMVRTAVERELTAMGYERATTTVPDFLVNAHAVAGDTEVAGTWDIYGCSDAWIWLDFGRAVRVDMHRDGTLIVDFHPQVRGTVARRDLRRGAGGRSSPRSA